MVHVSQLLNSHIIINLHEVLDRSHHPYQYDASTESPDCPAWVAAVAVAVAVVVVVAAAASFASS